MKIAIIYYGYVQWTEEQLEYFFKKNNCKVELYDIKKGFSEELFSFDIILNRVYASVANENEFDFDKFTSQLENLEKNGVKLINSALASKCDYDKNYASKLMHQKNVNNPITTIVKSSEDIQEFGKKHGYPLVIKPNTGGRGMDVSLIKSNLEIDKNIFKEYSQGSNHLIIQTLSKSMLDYDFRIFVLGNKILFANTRTLIDGWMGTRSKGSKIKTLKDIPQKLLNFSVEASKSIDAEINSLDIVKTSEGYSVIENNPTPNFSERYIEIFGFNPVEKIVEEILGNYSE